MDQTEKRKVTAFFIVTLLKVSVSGGYTQAYQYKEKSRQKNKSFIRGYGQYSEKRKKNKRKQEQVLH